MDVRSADVPWIESSTRHFAHSRPLDRDLAVEVAVVGAGVSGALAAQHLARRGVETVVLDRRQPGSGSTAACTALVQYELDQPLTEITRLHNEAHAVGAYQTCVRALDWLEELIHSFGDDCALATRPTLLLARRGWDTKSMQAEVEARRNAGIDTDWLSPDELKEQFGIHRPGAIRSKRSFELDPYRLTIAALDSAVQHGAKVYAPAEVSYYDFQSDHVRLRTTHGPTVRARKVVVVNGYETPSFLRKGYGDLISTWACQSEPVEVEKLWPQRQLMWEWGKPYLYARTTPDNRIIYGGGDRNFTNARFRDALIERKARSLSRKVSALVPGLDLVPAHRWAGTFAETADGMPYIGTHEEHPNTYLSLGFGGNGVTFSLIGARILTGLICGDAELALPAPWFRFDR